MPPAREYKLSYEALLKDEPDNVDLKLQDIEKMKKSIKNKRCAMDQDYKLVKELVEALNFCDDSVVLQKNVMIFDFENNEKKKKSTSKN